MTKQAGCHLPSASPSCCQGGVAQFPVVRWGLCPTSRAGLSVGSECIVGLLSVVTGPACHASMKGCSDPAGQQS